MQGTEAYFDRPLFVLGLPRSGTSLVAGLCKKSGFWLGSTVAADRNNPKGYFEHIEIREALIKKILSELGCDPLGVRKLPDEHSMPVSFSVKRKLAQILKRDGYRADRPWLYKDAKLSLLWPLFDEAFPNANWLIVTRDTESFVDSCLRTSFMRQHSDSPDFWRALADQYLQRLANLREASSRVFELHSPDLFAEDYSALERVLQAYGLRTNEAKLGKFINADHWHGKKPDTADK